MPVIWGIIFTLPPSGYEPHDQQIDRSATATSGLSIQVYRNDCLTRALALGLLSSMQKRMKLLGDVRNKGHIKK